MLAQNFMTPADLRISSQQQAALIAVLGMLERGEVPHEPNPGGHTRLPLCTFNMASWRCGTAGCIGGWADHFGAGFLDSLNADSPGGLLRLFYPDSYGDELPASDWSVRIMREIGTDKAASALRNYLTLGTPRWSEVLAA